MLKHIQRIVLIPPPEDKKMWKNFAELMASDIELINAITDENKDLGSLNNQQVRYFKGLVTALNNSICSYNIHKIFHVFAVVLNILLIEHFKSNDT